MQQEEHPAKAQAYLCAHAGQREWAPGRPARNPHGGRECLEEQANRDQIDSAVRPQYQRKA
jgi:hypothetical protein